MVVGARRVAAALVTVAAAAALAWGAGGRGCADGDATPAGTVRAFVAAARAEDKVAVWELLGPATRGRFTEAAAAATEKVGGARRFAPLDVLDVAVPPSSYVPTDVVAREVRGDHATVDLLGPEGRRDALELVKVDGRWRVELPLR